MEGTPDLRQYKDTAVSRDHSYYGNGCPNEWTSEEPYHNSSGVPCSNRTVTTVDGENQSIGSYYNVQALTSGTGGSMSTGETPDTFCPLGWQLPYGGTGGDYYNKPKSWRYLFMQYNIADNLTGATSVLSYPFSYILAGYYWHGFGLLVMNYSGYYYSGTITSRDHGTNLMIGRSSVNLNSTTQYKPDGRTLRCVYYFSIPSSTARWKERMYIILIQT